MKWVICHRCYDYAFVDENELRPETGCDDFTFAEYEVCAKEALDRGDQGALLHFISFCFLQRRDVPGWAQKRFRNAVAKAPAFEIKSWDEVFGRPLKKGKQLDAARRKLANESKIWSLINERRRAGEPLNKKLFEAVGKEVGIGGATVIEEIYSRIARVFREQEEAKDQGNPEEQVRTVTGTVHSIFEPPFDPRKDR